MDVKTFFYFAVPLMAFVGQWFWMRYKLEDLMKEQEKQDLRLTSIDNELNGVKMSAVKEATKLEGVGVEVKAMSKKLDKIHDLLLESRMKRKGDTDE